MKTLMGQSEYTYMVRKVALKESRSCEIKHATMSLDTHSY